MQCKFPVVRLACLLGDRQRIAARKKQLAALVHLLIVTCRNELRAEPLFNHLVSRLVVNLRPHTARRHQRPRSAVGCPVASLADVLRLVDVVDIATRFVSDLVIATGSISRKYAQTTLARVATHIAQDKFWRNQIVQINVLADGSMEIVPRVGDHIVYLGMPINVDKKLERLRKFYLYGLNKAGWNKYSYISVEFGNQIICKKRK